MSSCIPDGDAPIDAAMVHAMLWPMAAANPLLSSLLEDPVLHALDHAPLGEPFTPEQRAELDQATADIAAGRVKLVPHPEVQRALAEIRRDQGGIICDDATSR